MLNYLESIISSLHNVWTWGLNYWYDFVTQLVGQSDHESATLLFMIWCLAVTSILLGLIMVWRRPRTLLEKALTVHKLALGALFIQFLLINYQVWDHFGIRMLNYGVVIIVQIIVIFAVFKDYGFPDEEEMIDNEEEVV